MNIHASTSYRLPKKFSLESISSQYRFADYINGNFKVFSFIPDESLKEQFVDDAMIQYDPYMILSPQYMELAFKHSKEELLEEFKSLNSFLNVDVTNYFNYKLINRIQILKPFLRISTISGALTRTYFFIIEYSNGTKWLSLIEKIFAPIDSDFIGENIERKLKYSTHELNYFANLFIHNFDSGVRAGTVDGNSLYNYNPAFNEGEYIEGKKISINYKLPVFIKIHFGIDIEQLNKKRYISVSQNHIIDKDMVENGNVSLYYNSEDCAINWFSSEDKFYIGKIFSSVLDANLLIESSDGMVRGLRKEKNSSTDLIHLGMYGATLERLRKKYKITLSNSVEVKLKKVLSDRRKTSIETFAPFYEVLVKILKLVK